MLFRRCCALVLVVVIVVFVVDFLQLPQNFLVQSEDGFRVFVHNPGDAQGGGDFEQIWRQALVEAANSLSLNRLLCHVPDASIRGLMHHGALRLQSSTHHIERIHHRRTDGTGCCTNDARGYIAGSNIVLVASSASRIVALVGLFQQLKHAHVDGTIGEHAHQAHRHTTIACPYATVGVHLDGRLTDKGAARQASFHRFAL